MIGNQLLTPHPASMSQVVDFLISPSQQWLAIISVGEGHPMIDLVELPALLQNNEPKILLSINPFPGTINLIKWWANQLIVESDRLISQHNEALARVKKFYVTIDKTNQVSILPASAHTKSDN
jgi:CTP-dependent riboflavin kinase